MKLLNFFDINNIGNPPWDYYFLQNLEEKEYPRYLAKLFYLNTGEKLPLKYDIKNQAWVIDKKRCKTFNQKIQWLKLYGVTDLMRMCTDKVAVRDYVAEKIGSEYLKPVLQVCESFDEIDFDKLPNSLVIKCNHGCKWQYIIKNKEEFLNTPQVFETVKRNMTGWLEQEYWLWGGFEMQYKGIKPKLIIEEYLGNEKESIQEVEVYCFNGNPKITKWVHNDIPDKLTMFDEKFNCIDLKFLNKDFLVKEKANDYVNQTFDLSAKLCTSITRLAKDEMTTGDSRRNDSLERKQFQEKQLSKDFNFVRIDWIIFQNKIYFNEMTFTPNSGLIKFDKKWNKKLGSWIEI